MRNHNREENSFAFCSVSYSIWSCDKAKKKKKGCDRIHSNQGSADKEPLLDRIVIFLFFCFFTFVAQVLGFGIREGRKLRSHCALKHGHLNVLAFEKTLLLQLHSYAEFLTGQ